MRSVKQYLYSLYRWFRPVLVKGSDNEVRVLSHGVQRFLLTVDGCNNKIVIDDGVYLLNVRITVSGDNNIVKISPKSRLYNVDLRIDGTDNEFYFGVNAGVREADILIKEGRKVIVGDDSMLSYGINIRTTDSHSIIDGDTGERINPARDVIVGEHCWISQNVTLLKGAKIGDHSIVGFGSICSREYPGHCIIAGIPGKIIKENIDWKRSLT